LSQNLTVYIGKDQGRGITRGEGFGAKKKRKKGFSILLSYFKLM